MPQLAERFQQDVVGEVQRTASLNTARNRSRQINQTLCDAVRRCPIRREPPRPKRRLPLFLRDVRLIAPTPVAVLAHPVRTASFHPRTSSVPPFLPDLHGTTVGSQMVQFILERIDARWPGTATSDGILTREAIRKLAILKGQKVDVFRLCGKANVNARGCSYLRCWEVRIDTGTVAPNHFQLPENRVDLKFMVGIFIASLKR